MNEPDPPDKARRRATAIVFALMILLALALLFFGVWAASESIKKIHLGDATPTLPTSITDVSR